MNVELANRIGALLKGGHRYTNQELRLALGNVCGTNTISRTVRKVEERLGIDIEYGRGQGKTYTYYYPEGFVIDEGTLSDEDARQIDNLLGNLRYMRVPWMDEFDKKIQDLKSVKRGDRAIIYYDTNEDYDAIELFAELYEHIVKKDVIEFVYNNFGEESRNVTLHPYFLKEYIGRWYIYGWDQDKSNLERFALDRIDITDNEIVVVDHEIIYRELPSDFDVEKYFAKIVGVSRVSHTPVPVILRMSKFQYNYSESKRIHSSQRPPIVDHRLADDDHVVFKVIVVPNYEFRQLLRSFGKEVEVLEPETLREEMAEDVKAMAEMYGLI